MFRIENNTPTYEEAKASLIDLQKELNMCKSNLKNLMQQDKTLEEEQNNIRKNFEINLSNEEIRALQKYTNEISEPFSKNVDLIEKELEDLTTKFNKELEGLTEDHLSDYYYDKQEMLEEMRKVLDILNEKIKDLLGDRFLNELDNQVNSISIEIPEENLEEICNYFDKESSDLEKIKEKDNKILSIEKIVGKVNNIGTILETGNKQLILIVLVILSIVFYFAFKFVFPVYVLLLFLYAVYNVKLSNKIRTIYILRKAIQDNINEIENMYREKARIQLEEKRNSVQEDYETKKKDLEQELNEANDRLQSVLLSAKERFNFNDSKLKNELNDLLLINNNKRKRLQIQRLREEENLKLLNQKYLEAK